MGHFSVFLEYFSQSSVSGVLSAADGADSWRVSLFVPRFSSSCGLVDLHYGRVYSIDALNVKRKGLTTKLTKEKEGDFATEGTEVTEGESHAKWERCEDRKEE